MSVWNIRGVPEDLARAVKSMAASRGVTLAGLVVETMAREVSGGVSKKIAGDLGTGSAQEGGGTLDLPRLGKAQDEVTIYSGPHVLTARDGSTAFCDVRYCKLCASTEEEWRQRSADICGTCGAVHIAGEIYNHNFVRRDDSQEEFGSEPDTEIGITTRELGELGQKIFRNIEKRGKEGVGGGEKIVAEGSANEAGTATGKDRRNSETVSEGNDGGKSSAVGVGKSKVDIQALRDICAGKLPDIETVIAKHEGIAEQAEHSPDSHEVDLCGFDSYNETDGENYVCGKEKHGPKVKHGEWIQV